jgi:hypothetical protein
MPCREADIPSLTQERAKITDRFANAIGQLGDDVPEVRLGGIYALERIARDSRRDHGAVVEVLTAYVRTRAPSRRREPQGKERCERSSVQASSRRSPARNRADPLRATRRAGARAACPTRLPAATGAAAARPSSRSRSRAPAGDAPSRSRCAARTRSPATRAGHRTASSPDT